MARIRYRKEMRENPFHWQFKHLSPVLFPFTGLKNTVFCPPASYLLAISTDQEESRHPFHPVFAFQKLEGHVTCLQDAQLKQKQQLM